MTEIKRKRGRPRKVEVQQPVSIVVHKKRGPKPKFKSDVKEEISTTPRSSQAIVTEFVNYVKHHASDRDKDYITSRARSKGWSKDYFIVKSVLGFFNIDDPAVNLDLFKTHTESDG